MKKNIIITLAILAIAVAFWTIGATNAHALDAAQAGTFYDTTIQMGSTTTLVYNLSKNVWAQYGKYESGTIAAAYAFCTSHTSGDRTIGSGAVDQKVYFYEAVKQSGTAGDGCQAPADASASNFANKTGWSSL